MVNTKDFLSFQQLDNMTNEEIESYCFIPGDKSNWEKDALDEINTYLDHYPLLKTLSGIPLGYILHKIESNLLSWFPEDKKLNPRVLYCLQSILNNNRAEVQKIAITAKPNRYLSDETSKLNTAIGRVLIDKADKNIDI